MVESNDSFCASCHVQPEERYYQESLNIKNPETLAAYHAVKKTNCIECHSRPGFSGRLWAQYGGFRNWVSYSMGNFHSTSITTRPVGDGGCVKCHSDRYWQMVRPAHYHSPELRGQWRAAGGPINTCEACHPSHDKTIKPKARLLKTDKMKKACKHCHRLTGSLLKIE